MAVYIKPYSESNGTIAYASSVNKYIDDLASTVNALNSTNFLASSVGTTQLESASVNASKLDGDIRYFTEVFS